MATKYSEGIEAGLILISREQYERYSRMFLSSDMKPIGNSGKNDFVPMVTMRGTLMYRYKDAPIRPELVMSSALTGDTQMDEFYALVRELAELFADGGMSFIFTGDEDEDYTYGCMCTALATLEMPEDEWFLELLFGEMYSVKHISMLD